MPLVPLALRRDPIDVLASVAAEPGAFLLAVPDAARPVTLVGCAPEAELVIHADGGIEGSLRGTDPLAAIERFVAETPGDLPFPYGGAIGWLAYELARFTDPPRAAALATPDVPLAVLRRHDPILVHDGARGQWLLACRDPAGARAAWLQRLSQPAPTWSGPLASGPLAPVVSPAAYRAAVARALAYIAAGDVYQVNLTQPFTTPLAAPAWAVLGALARRHPAPYTAYLDVAGTALVANSPELFLRRRGARVETRPIKGTRPRGAGRGDAALAAELLADAKERAEHVMIVDLERNDLGRVCEPGSIEVRPLATVESHPTVHHLVSGVSGRLRRDVGLAAILRATFPGGSITGAPKVRAMEIIAELEGRARGAYTGAFGLLHPGGDLELGLAIRSAVVTGDVLRWDAGGGIVADSDPDRELAEAWLKTAAVRLALGEDAEGVRCSSG
jgi:anthranilate/para-aminobenzoate synthase component I